MDFPPYKQMLRLDSVNYDPETIACLSKSTRIVNLASGICKIPPPAFLLAAASDALNIAASVNDYDGPLGGTLARAAVAAWASASSEERIPIESVMITPGASSAVGSLARHLARRCGAGATPTALVVGPTYASAGQSFAYSGFEVMTLEGADGRGIPRCDDVIAKIDAAPPAVIYLNQFNNPTGQCLPSGDLLHLVSAATEAGCQVLIDAVTTDLTAFPWAPRHLSSPDLVALTGRASLFVVSGLAKDRALPGLRAGWIIGPPDQIRQLSDANLCEHPGAVGPAGTVVLADRLARCESTRHRDCFLDVFNTIAANHLPGRSPELDLASRCIDKAPDAHSEHLDWTNSLATQIRINLTTLESWLEANSWELLTRPDGGYNLMVGTKWFHKQDSIATAHRVFRSSGIQLMPGETFGYRSNVSSNHFTTRLSLAMAADVWNEGLDRLQTAFKVTG